MAERYGYPERPFMVIDKSERVEVADMRTGMSVEVPEDLWREIVLGWAELYAARVAHEES